ncbi:DUF4292 domain-containing protein [Mucilaginibacter robiniae]|uniref:DUF4292 domain-containing protein n=1 Tax=Mucilaginibacter robiniae TaxID=2728022 RepID=A0A7L5E4R1_9SPHI|nr:DUF4292 domain-containing protein [Mucilaginibacter robiniae]QJD96724.1 DUF4292 domain-containing protein [Mucilaginibacter robiniae]
MKRNILNKLLIAACVVGMWGCKAKKQLVSRPAAAPVTTAENSKVAKINAIRSRQVSYNTFSGKAKTKLNIDGKSNDVTLNIRIQHGQKIWVSITALIGIEVARAVITPDSIQVVNRLQSVYLKKPFSYIYTYASRQVNFNTVESLLVGNAIPELLNANASLEPTANGGLTIKGNLQGLLYSLMLGSDLKVNQTSLANQAANQSLQVSNSEFIQVTDRVMPSQIGIKSTVGRNNIQADLHYSRADFDQTLEYPFNIPDGYSPAH